MMKLDDDDVKHSQSLLYWSCIMVIIQLHRRNFAIMFILILN